jgi:thymidylate kinase
LELRKLEEREELKQDGLRLHEFEIKMAARKKYDDLQKEFISEYIKTNDNIGNIELKVIRQVFDFLRMKA